MSVSGGGIRRGQAKPVRRLLDQPDSGTGRPGAAQLDAPARRPRPEIGRGVLARIGGTGRRRQAGGGRDPPARTRRAGLGALVALVEDQARDQARRGREMKAPGGVEIDRVELRQHRRGRAGAQRLLEGPEPLGAGTGLDRQQPVGPQPERGEAGRVEGGAAGRDPQHGAAPGEAGEQRGGEARRGAVVRGTGDLMQAAGSEAAAELRVDRPDAERHGARARRRARAAGQRAARGLRLDGADPGGEGAACGGARRFFEASGAGGGIHAWRGSRAGRCPAAARPGRGS